MAYFGYKEASGKTRWEYDDLSQGAVDFANMDLVGLRAPTYSDKVVCFGNLDLSACTNLVEMPDILFVAGNLTLAGCYRLTKLPRILRVLGNCNLSGCRGLLVLPSNMFVFKDLDFESDWFESGPPGLQRVGEDITVIGSITNLDLRPNTPLPDSLMVSNVRVTTAGLGDMKSLPSVASTIMFSDCDGLLSFPNNLNLHELVIENCNDITGLPSNSCLTKLTVATCQEFSGIPNNMILDRLRLISLLDNFRFPLRLSVKEMELENMPYLKAIPDGCMPSERLTVRNCASLETLGVEKLDLMDIELDSCSITTLPPTSAMSVHIYDCDRLEDISSLVGGEVVDLKLQDCEKLTTLPEGLRVHSLQLRYLSNLSGLPRDLKVTGIVEIIGCPSIDAYTGIHRNGSWADGVPDLHAAGRESTSLSI